MITMDAEETVRSVRAMRRLANELTVDQLIAEELYGLRVEDARRLVLSGGLRRLLTARLGYEVDVDHRETPDGLEVTVIENVPEAPNVHVTYDFTI